MTRAEIFAAVYDGVSVHSRAMHYSLMPLRPEWIGAPWKLPRSLVCPQGPCEFDIRTLRFVCAECLACRYHAEIEEALNEARIAWQRDQQGWAAERAAKERAEAAFVQTGSTENCTDCYNHLSGRCGKHREPAAPFHAPQCYCVDSLGVICPMHRGIDCAKGAMPTLLEPDDTPLRRPAWGQSKMKGKKPMKSITQSVKRNALNAARKTAAKGVKDSARKAIVAAAQASDNPALHALAASLNTPHGDAALSVLVGVVGAMAMPALPGKLSTNAHITELFDNLQLAGFEHFTDHAYTEIAEPIIGAIAGELMAYAGKMAALEGGARKALNAPAEGCDCDE